MGGGGGGNGEARLKNWLLRGVERNSKVKKKWKIAGETYFGGGGSSPEKVFLRGCNVTKTDRLKGGGVRLYNLQMTSLLTL